MKIFVVSSDSHWLVDMFKYFETNHKWDILYWCCSDKITAQLVGKSFPAAIIHNTFDAMRGIPPNEKIVYKHWPLDERLLIDFANCELLALKMMDRMAALSDFSYNERVRLYHRLLEYNLKLIKTMRPDFVFFGLAIPHMVYDYIVYCICKYLGIKTIMFEKTNIPGLVYPVENIDKPFSLAVNSYEREKIKECCDEGQRKSICEHVASYLATVRGDYNSGMPIHMVTTNMRFYERTRKSIFEKIIGDLGFFYRNLLKGTSNNYLKIRNKKPEDYPTAFEYYLAKIVRKRKLNKLQHYYNSISSKVSFDEPYVFVALQCQPEKSTSPMGGVYVQQLLMVKLLRDVIPNNWKIFVKEHVAQFKSKEPARSKDNTTYDDIYQLPNTVIVPIDTDPFLLIDNSKFVACITGSVGFESIVRGKPILVFGNPWYAGCEGVFLVKTRDECLEAVQTIVDGYEVNTRNVDLFCQIFYEKGVHGYASSDYKEISRITENENLIAHIVALSNFTNTNFDFLKIDGYEICQ